MVIVDVVNAQLSKKERLKCPKMTMSLRRHYKSYAVNVTGMSAWRGKPSGDSGKQT